MDCEILFSGEITLFFALKAQQVFSWCGYTQSGEITNVVPRNVLSSNIPRAPVSSSEHGARFFLYYLCVIQFDLHQLMNKFATYKLAS